MAAIDPNQSAFARVRELIVDSAIATDTNWRLYAVERITNLSKVAVVSIGLAIATGGALAHGVHAEASKSGAESALDSGAASDTDARFARMEQLGELYIDALKEGTSQKAWAQLRPGLKIFTQYGDHDLGGQKTLGERVGMTEKDFRGAKSKQQIHEIDSFLGAIGRSEQKPATAVSLPAAYFFPSLKSERSFCTLSFNPHVDQMHDEIKRVTKWPDDVIRDYAIRHEATHCIEQADRNALLVQKLSNPNANVGPMISEHSKAVAEETIATMKRANKGNHVDDQARENLLFAVRNSMNLSSSNNSEEISDALAVLSLVKEGRLETSALSDLAFQRANSSYAGATHDTSSLLYNLARELKNQPEVVAQWRADHAKEVAAGSGLQVQSLLEWVTPRWKAHADARDQAAVRHKELREIPGFPSVGNAKSTEKTADHFTGMMNRADVLGGAKAKP